MMPCDRKKKKITTLGLLGLMALIASNHSLSPALVFYLTKEEDKEAGCPSPADYDFESILTQASIKTGGPNKGIVFTTVTIDRLDNSSHVDWVSNWYGQLLKVGVQRPLVFGVDNTGDTCAAVRAYGMCCRDFDVKDFTFTKPLQLLHKRDKDRPAAVDFKFMYAQEILSYGYRVSFSDDDVYWLKHPFSYEFVEDMRGLSDIQYKKKRRRMIRKECVLWYGAPCMSTGLWDIYPRNKSIDYIQGVVEDIRTSSNWEQALANQHLKNVIGKKNFSFTVFPDSTHSNVEAFDRLGKPWNTTCALHLGFIHGDNKLKEYRARGLWFPQNFSSMSVVVT